MRKTLTLALYLGFVELLSYLLVVVPAYSFQVSASTTGYVSHLARRRGIARDPVPRSMV